MICPRDNLGTEIGNGHITNADEVVQALIKQGLQFLGDFGRFGGHPAASQRLGEADSGTAIAL